MGGSLSAMIAEWRTTKRLGRTWILGTFAVLVGVVSYEQIAILHVFQFIQGYPAPRFSLPGVFVLPLYLLLISVVFIVLDHHRRESADRVAETVEVRPVSNLGLLIGRLVTMIFVTWLPLLAMFALLVIGSAFADDASITLGEAPEAYSVLIFLLFDSLPLIIAWCSLVLFVQETVRHNRLFAVTTLVFLIGVHAYWLLHAPLYLLPTFSGLTNFGLLGSDILPRWPGLVELAQRSSLLVTAFGLLVLTAAASKRRDNVRSLVRFVIGGLLLAVATCGFLCAFLLTVSARTEKVEWAREQAMRECEVLADIGRIDGVVAISPGHGMTIDIEMEVGVTDAFSTHVAESLSFALNPGLVVDSLLVNGDVAEYEHKAGLLDVAVLRSYSGSNAFTVAIEASGAPDVSFGYQDSALRAMDETLLGTPFVLLGDQMSIFEEDYVALMPGIHWMPSSRSSHCQENADVPPDGRVIDVHVHLPSDWLLAGPAENVGSGRWRVSLQTGMAEMAIIASDFVRRSLEYGGIEWEFLVHAKHTRNLIYLLESDYEDRGQSVVETVLGRDHDGLLTRMYPYPKISIVETPAFLRVYGGGRRLDTLQAMVGLHLVPEHGFPTRRFVDPGTGYGRIEGSGLLASAISMGPNNVAPIAGFHRHFLPVTMPAVGENPAELDVVLDSLTAHWLGIEPMGLHGRLLTSGNSFSPGALPERLWNHGMMTHGETSDYRTGSPNHARTIASAIYEYLGDVDVGIALELIRQRNDVSMLDVDGFISVLAEADPLFGSIVYDWLNSDEPSAAFTTSAVRVSRIRTLTQGEHLYQSRVHVRNEGTGPGLANVVWRTHPSRSLLDPTPPYFERDTPALVPPNGTVEIGFATVEYPEEVRLIPYLSRNLQAFRLRVMPVDSDRRIDRNPFEGTRHSEWIESADLITVDDLDDGFVMTSDSYDGEDALERSWTRQYDEEILAWGRYRHSFVRMAPGNGSTTATFTADLPSEGYWRLAYHLPGRHVTEGHWRVRSPARLDSFGTIDVRVSTAQGENVAEIDFDASNAIPGWNTLGDINLGKGLYQVAVSNQTSGNLVVADAIQWTNMEGEM